ncbi:MAG: T9SS type A sorting domain-containing protein, partial [Bacteroidota bacterium]
TDGGASWSLQTSGTTVQLWGVWCIDGGTAVAVGNGGTILRSTVVSLPVELTTFSASANRQGVELNWETATEVNNYGFEIEKKAVSGWPLASSQQPNANNWSKIGFVEGNGTTNSPKSYNFVDVSAQGKVAYRLKQIDRDGRFAYSRQVEVNVGGGLKVFALEQNYPNPFNPMTTIGFTIPADGTTTLKVYNTLGQEAATLVNEPLKAGEYHQVQFDASKLASGIYVARLQSGSMVQLKKMLLLK